MNTEHNRPSGLSFYLDNYLNIRPGEGVPTLAAVLYFFFLIMAYYVLKPIRESLALEVGSERIPALNIFSMVALIPANALYSWIVARFDRNWFIPLITSFFAGCLLIFWLIFGSSDIVQHGTGPISKARELAIATYFIWVNVFALFSVSMFWSFVNDVFTREQGQRLYGIIGIGGLVGGLFGSDATVRLVNILGTSRMFLVATLFLAPTLICMRFIHRLAADKSTHGQHAAAADPKTPSPKPPDPVVLSSGPLDGLMRTFSSWFLLLMAFEMFWNTFGSTLYSYQINSLMEHTIPGRDQRTLYWAQIYHSINALSIIVQVIVTTLVMRSDKQWVGLLFIPLVQLGGSLFLLQSPTLDFAASIGVVRYALNYSTGRAVRELFFTPLTREEKYQAKGFIDTLVFRGGDGIASALILSWKEFMPLQPWIDYAIILSMVTSCVIAVMLGRQFQEISGHSSGSLAPSPEKTSCN